MNTKLRPADRMRQVGMTEVVNDRSLDSKLFRISDSKFKLIKSHAIVHYDKNGSLEEVDLTPRRVGNKIIIDKAPYILSIDTDRIGFDYTSRQGGHTRMDLKTPILSPSNPTIIDNEIRWDNIAPGLDIFIKFHSAGMRVIKTIKSPTAPTSFIWSVTEDKSKEFTSRDFTRGKDVNGKHIQITRQVVNRTQTTRTRSYDVEENITGNVAVVKSMFKRVKQWIPLQPADYPLEFNQDITETIGVTIDDVMDSTGGFFSTYTANYVGTTGGGDIFGGVRFRTIAIGQSDTIDSASLITFTKQTSAQTGKIYADDVDDAALWSSGSPPSGITKTTASADYTPTTDEATETNDVKAIVQEIVNRGSWASNNNIRFGLFPGTITGNARFEDLSNSGTNEAILEINFTAAGGTVLKDLIGVGVIPFKR